MDDDDMKDSGGSAEASGRPVWNAAISGCPLPPLPAPSSSSSDSVVLRAASKRTRLSGPPPPPAMEEISDGSGIVVVSLQDVAYDIHMNSNIHTRYLYSVTKLAMGYDGPRHRQLVGTR